MTSPLLQVKDLRTWFPIQRGVFSRTTGYVRAVDGISFTVAPGETLGLVGESGCGKTTVARTLMRLDRAHSGRAIFRGQDLLSLAPSPLRALRRHMQIVFQDPFSSLNPRMTVLDIVTEGLLEHRIARARDREAEAVRLLRDVGMGPEHLHRYPHEFSGGQRQRIGVARALSLRPALILCDEAVSALDVSVQAQVINLLIDLRQKYGLSYLFISHDLSVVRHISHRVAVMYLGRLAEIGPVEAVLDAPCHPYTRALISAIPRVGADPSRRLVLPGDVPSPAAPPPGCPFHPRCPYAIERCRTHEPLLEPSADANPNSPHLIACHRKDHLPPH